MNNSTLVTRPLFPSLDEYTEQLKEIWSSQWLSNNGQKHQQLEVELKEYLDASNISLFNNGTIALLVAIQSLRLQGEVITTPFTFPATTHVLAWNNLTPVFCDIDYERMTIDYKQIEKLITAKTTAILGVHVYGVPCHVEEIQDIADRHGLKVIYDSAHAFSTVVNGRPIAAYGDISMFSFHPTKLFHTGEGGALVFNDIHLKQRIEYLKNFGIKNENEVVLPGINGKMGELQAAMGLKVLPLVKEEQSKRAKLREYYTNKLAEIGGVSIVKLPQGATNSEQYFCIRLTGGDEIRQKIYDALKEHHIFSRKYFYPLISDYPCYANLPSAQHGKLPVAKKVAQEVLCLPFYGDLDFSIVDQIAEIIAKHVA
tara:strand:+ start:674 stop:1783 length:1110 start_codon:yes stop_codon:yes gene_type:complete